MVAKKDENGLKSPFERDPELISKVGLVVTLWGTINNILRHLTAEEFNCRPNQADLILKQFSGEEAKLRFMIAIFEVKEPRDVALLKCFDHLKDLSAERNIIVHGGPIWGMKRGFYPPGFHIRNFRASNADDQPANAHELLDRHLEKIRRRGAELYDLVYAAQNAALDGVLELVEKKVSKP